MAKWTKQDIEAQRGTILRTGEFRVHIKYGRGGAKGNTVTARLWHPDGAIVGRANGGGYDMRGSVLGDAIELFFRPELMDLAQGTGREQPRGIAWRNVDGAYSVSVDGAVGLETMLQLLTALGFKARRFETGKDACMILAERTVTN